MRSDGYTRRRPEETVLYKTVAAHWPAFKERAEEQGGLPHFVIDEFEEYLKCGRLEAGLLRLSCRHCGEEMLVAMSCKRRAFCPACLGRRMADVSVHLSGYASRTGAVWLVQRLGADFSDMDAYRVWLTEVEAILEEEDFWVSEDHRLMWSRVSPLSIGDRPRRWVRLNAAVSRRWGEAPRAGEFVRVLAADERTMFVCDQHLNKLGAFTTLWQTTGAI